MKARACRFAFLALFVAAGMPIIPAHAVDNLLKIHVLCIPKRSVCVAVEIVDTPVARARGLMGRDRLEDRQGMLFVMGLPGPSAVWMKNMRFAIDILWLDVEGKIVDAKRNIPPCTQKKCRQYRSRSPASFVLEVPSGFIRKYRIKRGDTVRL